MESNSILLKDHFVLPLSLVPLELRKPTANASWQSSLHNIVFRKVTVLVLEFESLDLLGQLEALTVEGTINGRIATKRYDASEYSFGAPTQLGLVVDTATKKMDGSIDIHILFKPHWGLLEAGIRIITAHLHSFDPQPAFGEGLGRIPLVVEWNSYELGGIPPLSLYFSTTGYLGNASGSNQLYLSAYLEILGVESPWAEFFLGTSRLYQGGAASLWINTTISPQLQNVSQLALTVEYHPHRIADRHQEVTIRLEVYAEFLNYIDSNEAERAQLLAEMPKIPLVIANILILNAILLPLAYFRRQHIEEQEKKKQSQIWIEGDGW